MYDKIFAAGFIIGGTVCGYLGYKTGHKVGGFSPKRRLRKIRKVLGNGAEVARERAQKVVSKAAKILK